LKAILSVFVREPAPFVLCVRCSSVTGPRCQTT
jgi:hypothetical protein